MMKFLVGQRVCWVLFGLSVANFIGHLVTGEKVAGDLCAMGGWLCAALAEKELAVERARP